jgi:methionyl-tRNA synthetase
LNEYLEDLPNKQDVLRYVLTANAPETKDNDFTWKDYQARNNNELLAVYGNFVNRTLVLTHKYFGGIVPEVTGYNATDEAVIAEMALIPEKISSSIENYRFREALNEMMNLARLGNKYLTETEPWKVFKTDEDRVKTILNLSLQICANLTIVSEPFLPFSATKLLKMLNFDALVWKYAGTANILETGHQLGTPELLFEKIEDSVIDAQVQKLWDTKMANVEANRVVTPSKPVIEFDDFSKIDIRIGTIIAAEKVAKTKKLLKLTIDTGIDKRTVVSGIAEHYSPEEIIGQQVSILVNLAPRDLKGIESQGMILMAENEVGKLCFVAPTQKFDNGSQVK